MEVKVSERGNTASPQATGSARFLSTTLNPIIIFPRAVSAKLFANLDTYSQVAGCTPEKLVSQFAGLERLNHPWLF